MMYQNTVYICISWYSKICWFPAKKCWFQQKSRSVSRDSYYFLDLLRVRYNCAKLDHCRICVTDFKEGGTFLPPPSPNPWAGPRKPILNRVKILSFLFLSVDDDKEHAWNKPILNNKSLSYEMLFGGTDFIKTNSFIHLATNFEKISSFLKQYLKI